MDELMQKLKNGPDPMEGQLSGLAWLQYLAVTYSHPLHPSVPETLSSLKCKSPTDEEKFLDYINLNRKAKNEEIERRINVIHESTGYFMESRQELKRFMEEGWLKVGDDERLVLDKANRKKRLEDGQEELIQKYMPHKEGEKTAARYAADMARALREKNFRFNKDFGDRKQPVGTPVKRLKNFLCRKDDLRNVTVTATMYGTLTLHRDFIDVTNTDEDLKKAFQNGLKNLKEIHNHYRELRKVFNGPYHFFIDAESYIQRIARSVSLDRDGGQDMLKKWWEDPTRQRIPTEDYREELEDLVSTILENKDITEAENKMKNKVKKRKYDRLIDDNVD
ncbi:hypothetical protein HDV00_006973 [Rhizophlyctis rosea]|nr:hypothetical protein HDV00_006973 [Rhizophlyctis rosea]